jgi:ribosome-associated toxin RatA of RatAB toxin-antitoxin module
MDAPAGVVYELAADVLRWPELLPHYRYVRELEPDDSHAIDAGRIVKMAARRTGIPVSWTSIQETHAERGLVFYRHIAGVTKGMRVVWTIESRGHGCNVKIEHELRSPRWWVRLRPVRFIIGRLFVMHIADRTLRGLKRDAEARVPQAPA